MRKTRAYILVTGTGFKNGNSHGWSGSFAGPSLAGLPLRAFLTVAFFFFSLAGLGVKKLSLEFGMF